MPTYTDKALSSRWWYVLAVAAIAFYALNAIQLADSTPKFDDLNDVFGFFKELTTATSYWQTVGSFFYPNNEHITVTNHLLYWINFQLTGNVNFYWLMLTGHCIIILTACLLGLCINNSRQPFYFAIVILAYVNFYCWDSSFKVMTALSNQSVILFSVASLFILARTQSISAAITLAALASFSQGNGMLIWLVGGLMLATDMTRPHTKKSHLTLWTLGFFITSAVYFWAQHTYGTKPPNTVNPWELWQQSPLLPFKAIFAFLGSTGLEKNSSAVAIMIGLLGTVSILVCHYRNSQSQRLLVFIALFIFVSAITASGLRGLIGGNPDVMMESRYKMYSLAFVFIACLLLIETLMRIETLHSKTCQRWLIAATFLLALGLHANAYRQIPAIQQQTRLFDESYANWIVDGDFKRQAVYFAPMSDYFLFIAHHLKLVDFFQLLPADQLLTVSQPPTSNRTSIPLPRYDRSTSPLSLHSSSPG